MLAARPNVFRWWYATTSAPTGTPGVSVTPGASNAEGSATVLATSSNITEDCYGVWLYISGGNTSAQVKNHLLDIGVDPAGGTSYEWLVQNLGVGSSASPSAGGRELFVPLFIPAGSQVAVRIQGNNATAGTVRVWAIFYGRPTRPEMVWAGTYSENLGTIATSCGPAVTPGTSGAEGSWVNIGTTTRRLHWLYAGLQMNDSSTTAQMILMDVAINAGGTRQVIIEHWPLFLPGTAEVIQDPGISGRPILVDIPPGSNLDVRLSTSIATADGAYNVNLVGLG